MSLPDAPNTLREKYYSVMAGQNAADILPDIETAPSTENRYLDYMARHGGGGGGGDVTKAYVDEQDAKKTDKVTSAISGNFAGLDSNGNLTDSNKSAADFATASDMIAVKGVIPSTATTQNKLVTAADTAAEEIANTATGTSIILTDSADGYVQGVTVKGHSRKAKNIWNEDYTGINEDGVVYRSIYVANGTYTMSTTGQKNIVDAADLFFLAGNVSTGGSTSINGVWTGHSITVTTSDNYLTVAYRINNASDIADPRNHKTQIELGSTATPYEPFGIKSIGDAGWGVVDLGTLNWTYPESSIKRFEATLEGINFTDITGNIPAPMLCAMYQTVSSNYLAQHPDKFLTAFHTGSAKIWISNPNFTDPLAFKSAMSGVLLYYPLADATGATPTLGITSKNGEGQGTAATITTGLPLRSVSDSIYDTLDNEKVIKKCAEVDLGDLTWEYTSNRFQAQLSGSSVVSGGIDAICDNYALYKGSLAGFSETDKSINVGNLQLSSISYVLVRDTTYTDAATFKTAVTGVKLVYPLATPTETPLTSAEKSALASLRTYDHTTYIDATDAPTMTVDYLLNTNNGKAVANIQKDLQEQIDSGGSSSSLKSISWTGTGTATNNITFTEKPTLVLSIQITNKDPLNAACMPFRYGCPSMFCVYTNSQAPNVWQGTYTSRLTYSADELTMTITGTDKGSAWNDETTNYTLYYM